MAVHLGHAYRPIDPKPRACMIEVHEIILGNRTLEAREPSRAEVHDCEVMLGADPRPVYAFVGDLHPELGRVGLVVSRGWAASAFQGASMCDSGGLFMRVGGFQIAGDEAHDHLLALSSPAACNGATWQANFEAEVAGHFERGVRGYVDGDIPANLPAPRGEYIEYAKGSGVPDRRLWTWELRLSAAPSPEHYVGLALNDMDSKHMDEIERERGALPPQVIVVVGNLTPNGHPFMLPQLRELLLEGER